MFMIVLNILAFEIVQLYVLRWSSGCNSCTRDPGSNNIIIDELPLLFIYASYR